MEQQYTTTQASVNPLFRQEAITFRASRLQGEVLVQIGSPWLTLGIVCCGLFIALLAVASFATFSRSVELSGMLVMAEGTVPLVSDREALVETILVRDGDEVTVNQALATLRTVAASGLSLAGESYVLRSPANLRVGLAPVLAGQRVSVGTVVLELVPKTSRMEAELAVPALAVDTIPIGQSVELRVDASNGEWGHMRGRVRSLSLVPWKSGPVDGAHEGASVFYRALVELDPDYQKRVKHRLPMHAGTPLRASIVVGKSSVTAWFLESFRPAR